MRPGESNPNEFELALLDRLALECPDADIVVADLQILSRTFTCVGSFTEFLVKGPPVPRRVLEPSVCVSIPGLQYGLGVVAFRELDRLTLETFAFGDERWDGVFDGFELRIITVHRFPHPSQVETGNEPNVTPPEDTGS